MEAREQRERNRENGSEDPPGTRRVGVVVRWNNERGFGFIRPSSDRGTDSYRRREDLFVHVSAINDGNMLIDGARVEYERAFDDDKGKYRAVNVTGGQHDENRRRGFHGEDGRRFDDRRGQRSMGSTPGGPPDAHRLERMKRRAAAMRKVTTIWAPSVSPPAKRDSTNDDDRKERPEANEDGDARLRQMKARLKRKRREEPEGDGAEEKSGDKLKRMKEQLLRRQALKSTADTV